MNTELNIELAKKFEEKTGITPIRIKKLDDRNVRIIVKYIN